MKKGLLLYLLITASGILNAQDNWIWPEDSTMAIRNIAYYTDRMRTKDYQGATEYLEWLLVNAPNINKSIYINGVKIYDFLANETNDKKLKQTYLKKKLSLYDQRLKIYGETKELLYRRLLTAYNVEKNNPEKHQLLNDQAIKVMSLYGNDVPENIFVISMDLIRRKSIQDKEKSPIEILHQYDQLLNKFDNNNQKSNKTYLILKKMMASAVSLDCELLNNWLSNKHEIQQQDTIWLKRAVSYGLNMQCQESSFFVEAADKMIEKSPSYSLARLLAIKYEKRNEFNKSEKYYLLSINLAPDNEKKFQALMSCARYYHRRSKWALSKSNIIAAKNLNSSNKETEALLGDLYFDGAKSCMKKISRVEDRAIYIAAHKHYKLSGKKNKMTLASQQFPSMNDIFSEGLNEGDVIKVGCWVNEEVKLKRRENLQN